MVSVLCLLYVRYLVQVISYVCICICALIFRRVGKRKAAAPVDKGGKGKAKQTKKAKKDPNKPKKPPSAFFVFLYVSPSQ